MLLPKGKWDVEEEGRGIPDHAGGRYRNTDASKSGRNVLRKVSRLHLNKQASWTEPRRHHPEALVVAKVKLREP